MPTAAAEAEPTENALQRVLLSTSLPSSQFAAFNAVLITAAQRLFLTGEGGAFHPWRWVRFRPIADIRFEREKGSVQALLSVEPIYGWGWVGSPGGTTRQTPAPFSLLPSSQAVGAWEGRVQTPGHEFHGQIAILSQRHDDWDGCVNVAIGAVEAPVAQGWATVVDHELLAGKACGC